MIITWFLWASVALFWAKQTQEEFEASFLWTLMWGAINLVAFVTGYVYVVGGRPAMLDIARMVRDRPQHAATAAALALALVDVEGRLWQQLLPWEPALLLSLLDFLQLLLVRQKLVRPAMDRASQRDDAERVGRQASRRPYRDPRVSSARVAKRPLQGGYGHVGLSPNAAFRMKGRISTCWVVSVVVWLSTKAVSLMLVWGMHGEHPSARPTAVQDVAAEQPELELIYIYSQMLETHSCFAFAALCVFGLLSIVLPLSVPLFDAKSAQDLLEAAGDCAVWCRAAVARTAAAARSGLDWRLPFSRAQSLVLGGYTWFLHLLQLPVSDVVLSGASSLRAVVTRVCGWVVQRQTAAGVSRRAAAVWQSWQRWLSVFASGPSSQRVAPVAAAAAPETSSSSGAQPPASACRAAAAVSEQSDDCIVCFEARRSVSLLPCGHVALCKKCFAHVRQQAKAAGSVPCCPLCRTEVKQHVGGLVVV